jgi:hypothetical protein
MGGDAALRAGGPQGGGKWDLRVVVGARVDNINLVEKIKAAAETSERMVIVGLRGDVNMRNDPKVPGDLGKAFGDRSYETIVNKIESQFGSLDKFYEKYPNVVVEAAEGAHGGGGNRQSTLDAVTRGVEELSARSESGTLSVEGKISVPNECSTPATTTAPNDATSTNSPADPSKIDQNWKRFYLMFRFLKENKKSLINKAGTIFVVGYLLYRFADDYRYFSRDKFSSDGLVEFVIIGSSVILLPTVLSLFMWAFYPNRIERASIVVIVTLVSMIVEVVFCFTCQVVEIFIVGEPGYWILSVAAYHAPIFGLVLALAQRNPSLLQGLLRLFISFFMTCLLIAILLSMYLLSNPIVEAYKGYSEGTGALRWRT